MKKLLILLTIALVPAQFAFAAYDRYDDVTVEVVDDYGRIFPSYPLSWRKQGKTERSYVEAIRGAEYGVRVTNHTGQRIGLVIAVDGRNIISGKKSHLKRSERMYVLGPYQTRTYDGWRSSRNRVNRFYFTEDIDSYAGAFGDYTAMGVIAVAAFKEKNVRRYDDDDDDYIYRGDRRPSGKNSAESASRAQKHGRTESLEPSPGTGYGDDRYSPSRRVHFKPKKHAFDKTFLKYEWRETLCEKGIVNCYRKQRRNRFWDDVSWRHGGYAPPPPRHRDRWYWRRR